MPYEETVSWYNGYRLQREHTDGETVTFEIFSPRSIVSAMTFHEFDDYWNKTETFEALKVYIDMNYEGLRDAVIRLMAGDALEVNVGTFANDMTTFSTADDVLTLLVHLGYLGYEQRSKTVFVPNREVLREFVNATSVGGWDTVAQAVRGSGALLNAIVSHDEEAVAKGIERAHQETSRLSYNDENALAYTLSLGLYAARQWYTFVREAPAGKGFADLLLIPRRAFADRPAILVELKWDTDAKTAITQILDRRYPDVLADWMADGGRVILAGISYDPKTRQHTCTIRELG